MLTREKLLKTVEQGLVAPSESPKPIALSGARGVGVTTIARQAAARYRGAVASFDLHDPADRDRLRDPNLALSADDRLIVIDGFEQAPDLVAEVAAAIAGESSRRLLLCSARDPSPWFERFEALRGSMLIEVDGLALHEVGAPAQRDLWLRGGLPLSLLATGDADSAQWRRAALRALLQSGSGRHEEEEGRRHLLTMLAQRTEEQWNGSSMARPLQVAHTTVERRRAELEARYLVRRLPALVIPGLRQRQRSAPRLALRDVGMLHSLLGIGSMAELMRHPRVADSWCCFAREQVIARESHPGDRICHWASHSGGRVDLLIERGGVRRGWLFSYSSAPKPPRSAADCKRTLQLESLDLVHAGRETLQWEGGVGAIPLASFAQL